MAEGFSIPLKHIIQARHHLQLGLIYLHCQSEEGDDEDRNERNDNHNRGNNSRDNHDVVVQYLSLRDEDGYDALSYLCTKAAGKTSHGIRLLTYLLQNGANPSGYYANGDHSSHLYHCCYRTNLISSLAKEICHKDRQRTRSAKGPMRFDD